ncbi:MAG: hypothetical protein GX456_06855 [Verrucomicrobia bacterium]|nr:hypothetical protein [Verrucomicrobiota bacterium]
MEDKSQRLPAHPLAAVPGLDPQALAAFKGRWIETVEQVLSLSATTEGREGLRRLLGCDQEQLEELLAQLSAAVGPETARVLRQPQAGGECGLLLTDEHKKKHGLS